mgnify:CR=1 FL=1
MAIVATLSLTNIDLNEICPFSVILETIVLLLQSFFLILTNDLVQDFSVIIYDGPTFWIPFRLITCCLKHVSLEQDWFLE